MKLIEMMSLMPLGEEGVSERRHGEEKEREWKKEDERVLQPIQLNRHTYLCCKYLCVCRKKICCYHTKQYEVYYELQFTVKLL